MPSNFEKKRLAVEILRIFCVELEEINGRFVYTLHFEEPHVTKLITVSYGGVAAQNLLKLQEEMSKPGQTYKVDAMVRCYAYISNCLAAFAVLLDFQQQGKCPREAVHDAETALYVMGNHLAELCDISLNIPCREKPAKPLACKTILSREGSELSLAMNCLDKDLTLDYELTWVSQPDSVRITSQDLLDTWIEAATTLLGIMTEIAYLAYTARTPQGTPATLLGFLQEMSDSFTTAAYDVSRLAQGA